MKESLQREIEQYFDMRWNEDKNNILFEHGDNLFEQLPDEMKDKML